MDDGLTPLGRDLVESLRQVQAYERGELAARTRTYRRDGDDWTLVADEVTTGPAARAAYREARTTAVTPPPAYDGARVRAVRERLHLSQRVFAGALNVSPGTVQAWEQGRRVPDGPSLRLLEIAESHPDILLAAVRSTGRVAAG